MKIIKIIKNFLKNNSTDKYKTYNFEYGTIATLKPSQPTIFGRLIELGISHKIILKEGDIVKTKNFKLLAIRADTDYKCNKCYLKSNCNKKFFKYSIYSFILNVDCATNNIYLKNIKEEL